MTDQTTQQASPGPVIAQTAPTIAVPTLESVRDKANKLLLEIDNSRAHTEVTQFIIASRAQVMAALSFVEAHFRAFEQKTAALPKAAETKVESAFAFGGTPAAPTQSTSAPAATADMPSSQ